MAGLERRSLAKKLGRRQDQFDRLWTQDRQQTRGHPVEMRELMCNTPDGGPAWPERQAWVGGSAVRWAQAVTGNEVAGAKPAAAGAANVEG